MMPFAPNKTEHDDWFVARVTKSIADKREPFTDIQWTKIRKEKLDQREKLKARNPDPSIYAFR
jgi:hypothetical protein